ncbi:SOS response-associated peptidase [Magnetovibrio sp.]|uniref:SOS response-associated peptidase n=1 Tax=Magnetovibrio sp. TaxID=2024836 RepID=UPI002F92D9C6
MCGKFEVKAAMEKVKERFGLKLSPPPPPQSLHGTEMNPTNRILTIDGQSGMTRGRLLGWGLQVDWDAKPLINARAETLITKPTFRPLLNKRCLVPATAYFEWARPAGGAKQKMRIHMKSAATGEDNEDGELFAMAGLIGADDDTVTIVTCAPAPDIASIHDRMPVILKPEDEAAWIDTRNTFDQVNALLRPYDGGLRADNVDDRPVLL